MTAVLGVKWWHGRTFVGVLLSVQSEDLEWNHQVCGQWRSRCFKPRLWQADGLWRNLTQTEVTSHRTQESFYLYNHPQHSIAPSTELKKKECVQLFTEHQHLHLFTRWENAKYAHDDRDHGHLLMGPDAVAMKEMNCGTLTRCRGQRVLADSELYVDRVRERLPKNTLLRINEQGYIWEEQDLLVPWDLMASLQRTSSGWAWQHISIRAQRCRRGRDARQREEMYLNIEIKMVLYADPVLCFLFF